MSDEEVVNYLKENEEIMAKEKILAVINVIVNSMITKGWFSEEEFNKSYELSLDNLLIETAKTISPKERQQIKLIKQLDKGE